MAHYDSTTGEWSAYDRGLPEGYPFAISSDDEAVWLAQGDVGPPDGSDEIGGILRFDGRTWTRYLKDTVVRGISVAGDGTVWYQADGEVRRVEPLSRTGQSTTQS